MRAQIRILITIVVIILGIGIILSFVVIPSLRGIITLTDLIVQKRAQTEQALFRARTFRATASRIEEIHRELPAYENMIIEGGKEIDFFSLLETKNKQYNLDQVVHLNTSTEIMPSLEELPLELQIQGNFHDILAYLDELERAQKLMVIKDVTIRHALPQENKNSQKPLIATIKSVVYVYKK